MEATITGAMRLMYKTFLSKAAAGKLEWLQPSTFSQTLHEHMQ